jgi:hypothetical protein
LARRGIGGGPASAGTPLLKRMQVAERRARALRLRYGQGWSWQAIADELGYRHKGHACQDVQRYLDAHNAHRYAAQARARQARETYGPIIRDSWEQLLTDMIAIDPVELWLEAEHPGRLLTAIGALRQCIDEWLEPSEFWRARRPRHNAPSA